MSLLFLYLMFAWVAILGVGFYGLYKILSYVSQRKQWNGGKSIVSGKPWILFSIDRSGYRVYTDGGFETVYISFKSIDGFKGK